mmetsp:Transcript_37412/g.27599  ORF Transcript_37412/g.27599 Transcript_37412/m.27599 type:complete len:85 (+) Transcript_37412:315-569(+)
MIPRADLNLTFVSSKFGKQTIQKPHPCLADKWSTVVRDSYQHPRFRPKPHHRTYTRFVDSSFDESMIDNTRKSTAASGFVQAML